MVHNIVFTNIVCMVTTCSSRYTGSPILPHRGRAPALGNIGRLPPVLRDLNSTFLDTPALFEHLVEGMRECGSHPTNQPTNFREIVLQVSGIPEDYPTVLRDLNNKYRIIDEMGGVPVLRNQVYSAIPLYHYTTIYHYTALLTTALLLYCYTTSSASSTRWASCAFCGTRS